MCFTCALQFLEKLILVAVKPLNNVRAKTVGFIIEFNGVTKTVVQMTKSVGYLGRNKDVKYIILVGNQQIIFDTVMRAN